MWSPTPPLSEDRTSPWKSSNIIVLCICTRNTWTGTWWDSPGFWWRMSLSELSFSVYQGFPLEKVACVGMSLHNTWHSNVHWMIFILQRGLTRFENYLAPHSAFHVGTVKYACKPHPKMDACKSVDSSVANHIHWFTHDIEVKVHSCNSGTWPFDKCARYEISMWPTAYW